MSESDVTAAAVELLVACPVILPPRPGLLESWTHRPHLCIINGDHDLWADICREHGLLATAAVDADGQPGNYGCPASWNLAFTVAQAAGLGYVTIVSQSLVADGGTGRLPRLLARYGDHRGLLTRHDFHCITIAVATWELVGPFDEDLPICADVDWWRRAFLAGIWNDDDPVPGVTAPVFTASDERKAAARAGVVDPDMYSVDAARYAAKWGGPYRAETFDEPWTPTSTSTPTPTDPTVTTIELLDPDEVTTLLADLEQGGWHDGLVYNARSKAFPRRQHLLDPERYGWLYNRIAAAFAHANTAAVTLTGMSPAGAVRYDPGAHYARHIDKGRGVYADRVLSMTVLLAPADGGGELEIDGYGIVALTPGQACVFASTVLHQVRPVTAGRRTAIICFANGTTESVSRA
jgi:predicted 2-oxoglutarate/Fe(II)-dependent dioxygenase YbiX